MRMVGFSGGLGHLQEEPGPAGGGTDVTAPPWEVLGVGAHDPQELPGNLLP